MFSRGIDVVSAEVFQLRHRAGAWVLFGIWGTAALFFNYVLPYLIDREQGREANQASGFPPADLLPDRLVGTMINGFPFYGGAIALMLGVLSVGSEYGWGTFKTLFTQRPGRVQVFGAKMIALALMLVPFVLLVFAIGAVASAFIAMRENVAIDWPGPWLIARAMLAGWVILVVWAALGVTLAVATRGTSLAIGIGILYALVIEGLISNFAKQISWLQPVINLFLRANAYSLIRPLGGAGGEAGEGPGAFAGPYVDETQALGVLVSYVVVFLGVSGYLLWRRDVE